MSFNDISSEILVQILSIIDEKSFYPVLCVNKLFYEIMTTVCLSTYSIQVFFRHYSESKTYTLNLSPNMVWIEVVKVYIRKCIPDWTPVIGNVNMFKFLRFISGGRQFCDSDYSLTVKKLIELKHFRRYGTVEVVGTMGWKADPLQRNLNLKDLDDLVKSRKE